MKTLLIISIISTALLSDCTWKLVTDPITGEEKNVYICTDKESECKWVSVINPISGDIEEKYICN